jgi:phenylpropionate dioxygenase-like ring-hydroxylating dioxygenase large terminal subunit
MFYGRNEENGLRCVYHGWKFDTTGRCIDMPNEPPESQFKNKVRTTAYPCVERAGIIWSYLGPRVIPPPLPDIEANQLPDGDYQVAAFKRDCNWLQALEGDIDDSHVAYLHFGLVDADAMPEDTFLEYATRNRGMRFAVEDTEYGVLCGSYRAASAGKTYWRIGQFMFPFYTQVPIGVLGALILTQAWVPMDDHHTLTFSMAGKFEILDPSVAVSGGAVTTREYEELLKRMRFSRRVLMNTTDWFGRFRNEHDSSNDYLIDRNSQRTVAYSGMPNLLAEDQAVTESMGPVYDRSNEHLGTTDAMIIRTRRRLLDLLRTHADGRSVPPGVDDPEIYQVRAGGTVLPDGDDWLEAVAKWGKAHEFHPDVDLSPERIFRQPGSVLRSSVVTSASDV